jgi:hypothetical protein
MRIDTSLIPPPKHKLTETVYYENGDTYDIIKVIELADADDDKRMCAFAKQFDNNLYELWKFVRNQIRYKEDPDGKQIIKSAAALWEMGVGDCKSKTIFVNQVLRCLRIPYKTRFASYSRNPKPTHVYTVAYPTPQTPIIIDTVYHQYNAEKAYTHKKDLKMTRISRIAGIGSADVDKHIEELRHKASYIPKEEFLEYSKLSEGEAMARLMLEQMQIQAAMNPEGASNYKKGAELIKKTLAGGFHKRGNTITGAGAVPDGFEAMARFIESKMDDNRPAMRANRFEDYLPAAATIAGVGWNGNTYTGTAGSTFTLASGCGGNSCINIAELQKSTRDGFMFSFGATTPYAKKWSDINSKAGALVEQMMKEAVTVDGTPLTLANNAINKITSLLGLTQNAYWLSKRGLPTSPSAQFTAYGTNPMQYPSPFIQFASQKERTEFIERLQVASGVLEEYANKTLENQKGTGNAFIYTYCNDIQGKTRKLNINDYPLSVVAKYSTHAGYTGGMAMFTGLSESIIKQKGINNVATKTGKTPQNVLSGAMAMTRPAIGLDPATITAIVMLINAVVAAIIEAINAMKQAKAEGELMKDLPETFKPIGESLQFSDDDWSSNSNSNNNSNNSSKNQDNTNGNNSLLLLGGLGLGYYFLNKK